MSSNDGDDQRGLPPHLRELSYEIHTNRELEFMLKGVKPFAYFNGMIVDDCDMWEPDEEFERQVELGVFVKHEVHGLCEPYMLNGYLVKGEWSRFYALKDEAWRIPAFMLLNELVRKHPWSDALERMSGTLLGYTDEQNDEWLAKRQRHHAGWQCITLYATVSHDVLDGIAELGYRAFPNGCLQSLRLFTADSVPTRQALEKAGRIEADSYNRLIRFGVHWHFLKDCLEHEPAADIAPAAIKPGVEARDLNKALRTDIQVFEFHDGQPGR
jgi:hypothetical protein